MLGSSPIAFRSTSVDGDAVAGELTMAGATRPVTLRLETTGGRIRATIPLVQSEWGIKPYRGLMGALKVRDDVEIVVDAPARLADEAVEPDRQVAHALAGGVEDGVGDRRRGADDPDLADALRPHRVELVVVLLDPRGVDVLDVRADRHVVLGEVVVEVVAELAVHDALLVQRHREAHGHAADELRARRLRVDDAADAEDAEHPREADLAAVDVDADLDELGAEGVA